MRKKEYLQQAHRLDHRIRSDMRELDNLKEMSGYISPSSFEKSYNPNRPTEAPFVRALEKLWDLEQKIAGEVELFADLKAQIRETIASVENEDEQMVLRYCYIEDKTWEEIGGLMHASRTTVIRWHNQGLYHMQLPENPIWI